MGKTFTGKEHTDFQNTWCSY